jgi:hypothetical protein
MADFIDNWRVLIQLLRNYRVMLMPGSLLDGCTNFVDDKPEDAGTHPFDAIGDAAVTALSAANDERKDRRRNGNGTSPEEINSVMP